MTLDLSGLKKMILDKGQALDNDIKIIEASLEERAPPAILEHTLANMPWEKRKAIYINQIIDLSH